MYVCVPVYIYIYIYIEREREREIERSIKLSGRLPSARAAATYKRAVYTVDAREHVDSDDTE